MISDTENGLSLNLNTKKNLSAKLIYTRQKKVSIPPLVTLPAF
jgi:hypothetical protein